MEHNLKAYRRKNGCRCEVCKAANAQAQRDYQEKKKKKQEAKNEAP